MNSLIEDGGAVDIEDLNYFEMYRSEFDKKVLEWCDNEIKELSTDY